MTAINLVVLHKEMRLLCLEAKIGEKTYDLMLEKPEILPKIIEIYENEYKEVLKIKALLPEAVWQQYKAFRLRDLREIEMLRVALTSLRMAFYRIIPRERKKSSKQDQAADVELSAELECRQANVDSI